MVTYYHVLICIFQAPEKETMRNQGNAQNSVLHHQWFVSFSID